MSIDPQTTFVPNCKFEEKTEENSDDTIVLAWNVVGTVTLRKQDQFKSIDIQFKDRTFHRNLSINDDFRCSMACLNYSGLLLASKGDYDDDKYDEDEEEDEDMKVQTVDKRGSYVYFKPLNEWKKLKDWNYKMPYGESI